MKRLALVFLLLPCCGCQQAFNRIYNRVFASRCVFKTVIWKPGDRYIDYDAMPRTWVEVGADNKHRPIPTPLGEIDPLDPNAGQQLRQ